MTAYSYFLAQKEAKTTSFLTFSGAEKEAKRHPPPTKPPPIWGVLNEKSQKPSTFRAFWYRGTRDGVFIGWRIEGCKPGHAMVYLSGGAWRKSLTLIIYTIAKYSFRKSSAVICLISNSSKPRRSRVKMTSAPNTEFE